MKCRVEIDTSAFTNRIASKFSEAQTWLDSEVLKDCDPFVPMRSGNLARSGQRGTVPGSGKVIWDAPYARVQYFKYPRKSLDKHPQASIQWFEKAKAIHLLKWVTGVKKIVTK